MKSFFASVIIVLSLVVPSQALAQQVIRCDEVTADSYPDCCSNQNYGANREMCDAYNAANPPATQTMSVNNSYGQCLTYQWQNGKWVLIKTDIHPCGWAGTGPTTQCSDGITAENVGECCSGTNETIYSVQCAVYNSGSGTVGSGNPNTNPTNGGTTPPTTTPTPSTGSAALASCSKITFKSLLDILIWLKCIIGAAIIPLIFAIGFVLFLWGMVMYIRGSDDVKKREEGKKFIYWSILSLTLMVGVWGVVRIVTTTFGLGNTVPELQTDYLKTPTKK